MRQSFVWLLAALILASCGGAPAATADQVAAALTAAGAVNVHAEAFRDEATVPRSFTDRQVFAIASIAPAGGQFFVCDTKANCDAIYAYYAALKALAGPYLYQSPSGTVVVQLNSTLAPTEATKFEQAVKALP